MPLVSKSITNHPFNWAKLLSIKTNNPTKAIVCCVFWVLMPHEQNIMMTPKIVETIIAFITNSFYYLANNCSKVSAVKVNKGCG